MIYSILNAIICIAAISTGFVYVSNGITNIGMAYIFFGLGYAALGYPQ